MIKNGKVAAVKKEDPPRKDFRKAFASFESSMHDTNDLPSHVNWLPNGN